MAKNWTLKEAVSVLTDGTNKEAIKELGSRFPLTSIAIAKMGSNQGVETLFGSMPEYMTMLKMERALKGDVSNDVEENDEHSGKSAENSTGNIDLESMTTKQLYEMCIKKGIKVSKYGKPKSYYIEQLSGSAEEDEEIEEEIVDYDSMSAVDLFKLCKQRGLKVEPKKKASVYVETLKKADEEAADQEEEDEDWEEEDEEDKKPAKASKSAKPTAKSSKKSDPNEDEDWDI